MAEIGWNSMKPWELKLAVCGASTWLLGTVYYFFRAGQTFERGPAVFWINSVITVAVYVLLFRWLVKALRVAPVDTGRAALLFIVPGMAGEIPVLLNFTAALPTMRLESASSYSAFLFCGYVAVGVYALVAQERRGN